MRHDAYRMYRIREDIPQNHQEGDCGIYAFKYISVLVLSLQFVGLGNDAISDIREKLAADLFDLFDFTHRLENASFQNLHWRYRRG